MALPREAYLDVPRPPRRNKQAELVAALVEARSTLIAWMVPDVHPAQAAQHSTIKKIDAALALAREYMEREKND